MNTFSLGGQADESVGQLVLRKAKDKRTETRGAPLQLETGLSYEAMPTEKPGLEGLELCSGWWAAGIAGTLEAAVHRKAGGQPIYPGCTHRPSNGALQRTSSSATLPWTLHGQGTKAATGGIMEEPRIPNSAELMKMIRQVLREELQLSRPDAEETLEWPCSPLEFLVREQRRLAERLREQIVQDVVTARCRFSEDQAGGVMRLLTGFGGRTVALKDLKSWVRGATRLVIADPYVIAGNSSRWGSLGKSAKKSDATAYAQELNAVLGDVEDIDVFFLPDPPKEMKSALKKEAFKGRRVRYFPTTEIHDRVWIKDATDARLVGTSFGGIGRKLAFILELPSEDRQRFSAELERIRRDA